MPCRRRHAYRMAACTTRGTRDDGSATMTDDHDYPYNRVITDDYLEENIYPEDSPALILLHNVTGESVRPHWHRGLELSHCFAGTATWTIDSSIIETSPGHTTLISPYAIHEATLTNDGYYSGVSITFNNDIVEKSYPYADRNLVDFMSPTATDDDRSRLTDLVIEAAQWHERPGTLKTLRLNAILYEILYLVYSKFVVGVRRPELVRNGRHVFIQVVGFIESHYAEPLTAQDVASRFGYSREHFSRLFKEATGMGFKQFVTRLRLQDAERRIARSTVPIADVVRSSGFADSRSMCAAFERAYGMTPSAYRRAQKAERRQE
ncbi:AraC family transcriptional regulator [Bifidobacterium primatium]|uniref:AraC family transcriptional regulator n=2 Tax=Bifidobacterium primatium TaxID=2045438 RepID=A0A2M9H986_9BIFI|nr:AraC family transcriptional regulator [Bifidobacterium primatium]